MPQHHLQAGKSTGCQPAKGGRLGDWQADPQGRTGPVTPSLSATAKFNQYMVYSCQMKVALVCKGPIKLFLIAITALEDAHALIYR